MQYLRKIHGKIRIEVSSMLTQNPMGVPSCATPKFHHTFASQIKHLTSKDLKLEISTVFRVNSKGYNTNNTKICVPSHLNLGFCLDMCHMF